MINHIKQELNNVLHTLFDDRIDLPDKVKGYGYAHAYLKRGIVQN